jgi:hypothetical protein
MSIDFGSGSKQTSTYIQITAIIGLVLLVIIGIGSFVYQHVTIPKRQ